MTLAAQAGDLPHVEIEALSVARDGRCLVEDLSLQIPRGSFVAVIGPSGAGKSSLLACLSGLLEPTQGQVQFRCERQCLHRPGDFQRRLGLVFQHLRLTPNASVLTNVLCGMLGQRPWWRTLFGFPAQDRQRAQALLYQFGVERYAAIPAGDISGGERQRVAIARALIPSPELVLADEPVSHLDSKLARQILGDLKRETQENQRTVVCVLHDPRLVEEFADFVLELSRENPRGWSLTRRAAE